MTEKLARALAAQGLRLPAVVAPVAAYRPAVRLGSLVYTSGQIPFLDGRLSLTGHLGAEVDVAAGKEQARLCALNCLAAATSVLEAGEEILDVVKVTGFVASADGFTRQPEVVDGASSLLLDLFPNGHARSAVGVAELPLGAPVEVELIAFVG